MREWASVLSSITGEEIAHGLDTWDSEYPPNVYQFKATCKSQRRSKSHTITKALPKPKPNPETVNKNIKQMRVSIANMGRQS